MKRQLILLLFLLSALPMWAQIASEDEYTLIDDESCGCELYFVDSIQTTKRDGLFGFKLANGRELVTPQYMFVDQWHGDYCLVYRDYYQCGLINRQGKEVVPCIYREISYPAEGMIRVNQNDLIGFLHEDGSPAITPQYRAASTFSEDLAVVALDVDSFYVEYAWIDKEGNICLRNGYEYVYPFFNGYAVVKKYDRFGIIDTRGVEVVPIKYEFISGVDTNGIFIVRDPDGDKFALFSIQGFKAITPFRYDDFIGYGDGLYNYRKGDLQGYLDTRGREVFGTFTVAAPFSGGYAMVSRGDKYGIIDSRGHTVLPIEYDYHFNCPDGYLFHNGLAPVEKDGLVGFCNEAGQIVIPLQYEDCFGFHDSRAPVKKNGLWGYIDTDGSQVVPFVFRYASPFKYGRAEVVSDLNVHKINVSGKCVKACQGFPQY